MLRRLLLIGAAALCLSGAAMAQSMPVSHYQGASATPAFQGLYAGLNLGVGIGEAGPNNSQGFFGGGQVGFNFTADKLVFGVEADIMLTGINANSYSYTFTQRWMGSGRVRLGYQLNSLMIYGTGGLALSTLDFKDFGLSQSTGLTGWVAGAGAEMFVTQNVSLRGEYLYYSLGRPEFMTPNGPILASTSTSLLRVGANYKF